MSETATVTIEKVTKKEGATAGRAWLKYTVHAEGQFYSTFDGAVAEKAHALVGQRAEIFWKPSGDQDQYRDILNAKAVEGFDAAAIPAARDSNGAANWDEIGLRKTRCLLWAEYLSSPLAAMVASEPGAKPTANRVFDFGVALVTFAEADIYFRPIADEGDSVPF